MLEKAGRVEEAITWLRSRAETGDTTALWEAAGMLQKAGRGEEAARLSPVRDRAGRPDRGSVGGRHPGVGSLQERTLP